MKVAEAAGLARKAARKQTKARARALARENRKLSTELTGPPALRTMTAEGSASDMAVRRRCTKEEMVTLSNFFKKKKKKKKLNQGLGLM